MSEIVKVKRDDLEYLKKGFEFLQNENEELKLKIMELEEEAASTEDIGVDLSNIKLFLKEENPPEESEDSIVDEEPIDEDDEVEEITVPRNLSEIVQR